MALRTSLDEAFGCSPSNQLLTQRSSMLPKGFSYPHAFRQSTFCPCPGGDAPSAKRMFDALFAGCIPVVLSEDFVWPFTKEAGSQLVLLDPNTFSIRLKSDDYTLQDPCGADRSRSLQTFLEKNVSAAEVLRLRKGVHKAAQIYAYYQRSKTLPDNPLQHSVLPDGGAALALVTALAKRAGGVLWPECEEELKKPRKQDPTRFKC